MDYVSIKISLKLSSDHEVFFFLHFDGILDERMDFRRKTISYCGVSSNSSVSIPTFDNASETASKFGSAFSIMEDELMSDGISIGWSIIWGSGVEHRTSNLRKGKYVKLVHCRCLVFGPFYKK